VAANIPSCPGAGTVKKPNGIGGGYEEGTRYRLKLIRGSFLEVWEGRGLSQLSSFSRYYLPLMTTEIYL